MKNLKIFENFEARVFSHKKFLPQIRASFTHVARASYPHNFFFGTVQMTRGQRARVFSHQKLVPQIRASFTHHARASSTRRYACFTRGPFFADKRQEKVKPVKSLRYRTASPHCEPAQRSSDGSHRAKVDLKVMKRKHCNIYFGKQCTIG